MDKIILPYRGKSPAIDPTAFIAPSAAVIGDVTIGAHSSVWFGAVVRGDFQPIRIGSNTNIQENATIHVMRDVPVEIGDHVLIGHNAVVHCSKIGSNTLIGMGSIVMGYSEIGENVVIGAGTFLPQHKRKSPRTRSCSVPLHRSCARCATTKSRRCKMQRKTTPTSRQSTKRSLRS